jgi:hypothetical protein
LQGIGARVQLGTAMTLPVLVTENTTCPQITPSWPWQSAAALAASQPP